MVIRRWYWAVLALWCVTGLPIYALGQGMAGDSVFDVFAAARDFNVPTDDLFLFLTRLVPWLIVLMPVVALPFALKRKRNRN